MEGKRAKSIARCPVCGENTELEFEIPSFDGSWGTQKMRVSCVCRCRKEERAKQEKRMKYQEDQARINELKNLSLLDNKLKSVNFSTYQVTEENRRVFNLAKKYVQQFDLMVEKAQGLLFWGDVGTGKSYTAAAIANELMNKLTSVVMTSFVNLLKMQGFGSEDGYIDRINQAKLLVIDDLGAERGTDYALEKVYDIVDGRYRVGKPVIFTTNLTISQMKESTDIRYNRIYDRIFEMCYPVKFVGLSWRKKDAANRYDEVQKILEG